MPASHVKRTETVMSASQQQLYDSCSVGVRQAQIEKQYELLMVLAGKRSRHLRESCKAFSLLREAADMEGWIRQKEKQTEAPDIRDDLEKVEVMQKKFDDFQVGISLVYHQTLDQIQ